MNIGPYTFEEFKEVARKFHGYPAPGLLIGGYMVEEAKKHLPADTLFDAVVETGKCLPDAVQILTLCSYGNGWMKVIKLGRYALSLYDKYTGKGVRIHIDTEKLENWPEIKAWFLKLKPKKEQDTDKLFAEICEAGPSLCSITPVQIAPDFMGHKHMRDIGICPSCNEAYPLSDGAICRGCQGEVPYVGGSRDVVREDCVVAVEVEDAVGRTALHDMTRIEPGVYKGPEFKAGQEITAGDVCRLQQMGRNRVYVQDESSADGMVHENEAAQAFADRMAGEGIVFKAPPEEGKISFCAAYKGLFSINRDILERFNMLPDVMCTSRQGDILVDEGKPVAGTRAIPLHISETVFRNALSVLDEDPLFSVIPLRKAKVGILVTGTEVFQGLIEDKFVPIISGKVERLGCEVAASVIVPDDKDAISNGVNELLKQGADLIVTTAGLSVDPDDATRAGLVDAGLKDALFGVPALPGTMLLLGKIQHADVIGVPACALFYKITSFDLVLPRILAGQAITRKELTRLAEGGLCLNCRSCTFPKCPFGK
ncbi:FmdE family protein [Maridesulfovibrio salexigens]|uniref:Formylmethanofuran dehydrogenase subunit E region n=1 Tax=Maridesulfovibrio salexigens (strain ATCC 14822 / DSM 2638 / NCIMB 8403 / VKM B-1763) TaxID=526222 RepID=C6BWW7_MARSD|nr:FmdE family protein [Maridesulfovibrio salexigens]ACS78447.1 formylmethanofuran dehydrogenase subunit E region [Maridesulfovibrio salexigens DSM 2638]